MSFMKGRIKRLFFILHFIGFQIRFHASHHCMAMRPLYNDRLRREMGDWGIRTSTNSTGSRNFGEAVESRSDVREFNDRAIGRRRILVFRHEVIELGFKVKARGVQIEGGRVRGLAPFIEFVKFRREQVKEGIRIHGSVRG